jgi:hypothetical protein
MKLDLGIHIGMHLICFSKTRCDSRALLEAASGHAPHPGPRHTTCGRQSCLRPGTTTATRTQLDLDTIGEDCERDVELLAAAVCDNPTRDNSVLSLKPLILVIK